MQGSRFIIAGLSVPVDQDDQFRFRLERYSIAVISAARLRAHETAYTLLAPSPLALWQFIGEHLGPAAADAEIDRFIAWHVRPVAPARHVV